MTLVNGNAASGYESEGVGPERVADLAALSPGQLDAYCSQVLLLHCGCRRCRFRLWVEYGIIDLRVA